MATSRRSPTAPLHPEQAALILAGVAIDIDALAERIVRRLRQLEAGAAGEKLIGATRRAAISLEQTAACLRREGLLGPPDDPSLASTGPPARSPRLPPDGST